MGKPETINGAQCRVNLLQKLEQKENISVEIGQKLVNLVVDFFDLKEVTGGSNIDVDAQGVENILYDTHSYLWTNKIDPEIFNAQRSNRSIKIPHLIEDLKSILRGMKVNGKNLFDWNESTGDFRPSEIGMKIEEKLDNGVNLDNKNKDRFNNLLDTYQQFMESIEEMRNLDNKTGGKIKYRADLFMLPLYHC